MTDIFEATILCKNCNTKMRPTIVSRNGLELRAIECPKCHDKIIHPADLNAQEQFKDLKDKKFNVKLRMVGNSHAISIPKEIIDFMSERHRDMKKDMDEMVSMCFDDFDTLKVSFLDENGQGFDNGHGEMDEVTDKGRIRRKVRDDGRGNVDIIEEQTLNDPESGVRGIRFKKIRRRIRDD